MKTKKIFVFLSILVSNISLCQNFFEVGLKEFNNTEYKQAKDDFDKAIENKQNLSKSYMYRAGTNIFFKDLKSAKEDLDTSFNLDSLNESIFFWYAKYYFAIKDYKMALINYNKAISINDKFALAYCERGVTNCTQGDCNEGLSDMNKAIRLDPNDGKLYSKRGYTKIMLKQYEEAIDDIDISLKMNPNQKDYANKGLAYFNLKMYALAILNFTKSLNFNPNDPEVLFYRGNTKKPVKITIKVIPW
jgi:tetratricopeptide (TPR) repeat protein